MTDSKELYIRPVDDYACTLYTIALRSSYERDLSSILFAYSNCELSPVKARSIIDNVIDGSSLLKRTVTYKPDDNRTLILNEKSAKLMLKHLIEACDGRIEQIKLNKNLADLIVDPLLSTSKKVHSISMQTQGFDSDQLRSILFEIAAKTHESNR
jgi:hypothetical protein